jgi:hydroxyethylthiazole kinase
VTDVLQAGAHGVAVVSAIASAPDPERAAAILAPIIALKTSFDRDWSHKVASLWTSMRLKQPMVQHLTNYVVMNSTANVTLAVGARPIMSHETELVSHAGSVLINIGTIDEEWARRYEAAAAAANAANVPIILDPVGVGATALRTDTALNLLTKYKFSCVKGNAGELGVLARDSTARVRGVDSDYRPSSPSEIVSKVSKAFNVVAAMTGKIDYVSDGLQVVQIHNGSCILPDVTGTGCAASTVVSAMLGATPKREDRMQAVVAGLTCFAIAAEKAEQRLFRSDQSYAGPASFWNCIIDELYHLSEEDIIDLAKIGASKIQQD